MLNSRSLVSEKVFCRLFVSHSLQGFEANGSVPRQIATHRAYQAALRQSSKRRFATSGLQHWFNKHQLLLEGDNCCGGSVIESRVSKVDIARAAGVCNLPL